MIGMSSLHDNVEIRRTLDLDAHTAGTTGATVSLAGSEVWMFQVFLGFWTDGTHTLTFEHRHPEVESNAWQAVPANMLDADGGVLAADGASLVIEDATRDGQTLVVGYIGGFADLRVKAAVAGATTGAVYGADVVRTSLRYSGKNPMSSNWSSS